MKKVFLFITFVGLLINVFAQELTIKDAFREVSEKDALTNKVYDYKHDLCALIKIGLEEQSVVFYGNVIQSEYKQQGVWWVYMSEGSTRLEIKTSNSASKVIIFDALIGGVTYSISFVTRTSNKPVTSKDLFGEDFEEVTKEIRKKVNNFNRYVNNLAGNSFTHWEKEERYQLALELFIGKGNPYEVLVPSGNGDYTQIHEAVKMGVFPSKNNQVRKYYPMKEYLSRLIRNSENPNYRYKRINIECSNAIRLDNFRKIGDGRYIALAHYLQKYTTYTTIESNVPAYTDYTEKTVTIYINSVEVTLPSGETEHYWQVLLGDVDCDDVW